MLNQQRDEGPESAEHARGARPLITIGNLSHPLDLPEDLADTFRLALCALVEAAIPFSVGGGLAVYSYTGEHRDVHDLDIHLAPADVERAQAALRRAGFTTWVRLQPWLAQAHLGGTQVDLIYGQGTGHISVDQDWVERGTPGNLLGVGVVLAPAEEIVWSKALRQARVRSDQSDVCHLLRTHGSQLDWAHLLDRFGEDWEVLLSTLIMFRYVFPSHHDAIPDDVLNELLGRLARTRSHPYHGPPVCRGTIVDSSGPYAHYPDLGYIDERQRRWERRLREEPVLQTLTRTAPPPARDDRAHAE